jgi:hypothetical protein
MKIRWFKYYCCFVWREYLVEGPGIIFDVLTRCSCDDSNIHGIEVTDPRSETRKYFNHIIQSALTLVATVDPNVFARVSREIRYIVNAPAFNGCTYGRTIKVCSLDIRCYYIENDLEMTNRLVAAAIIRVATIGHLYSNGILRYRLNRERCNALCFKESQRFLRRCGVTTNESDPQNRAAWSNCHS